MARETNLLLRNIPSACSQRTKLWRIFVRIRNGRSAVSYLEDGIFFSKKSIPRPTEVLRNPLAKMEGCHLFFIVAQASSSQRMEKERERQCVRMAKFWRRKSTVLALESSRGRNASALTWTLHEARRTTGAEIGIKLT